MGENSNIEWCYHTYNHWIGCSKVSPGCANCYAESENNRRKWAVEGWGPGKPRKLTSERNHSQPFAWDRKAKISGQRHRVFCSSLADWLDNEVPIQWLVGLLKTIRRCRHLDWLMLTKRPQNFLDRMEAVLREPKNDLPDGLSDWIEKWLAGKAPQNVWMGVSTEDQERADERIPMLLSIPAQIHWLSVEPLIGPLDLSYHLNPLFPPKPFGSRIDWVVVGGESGPKARPMLTEWARSLRDQCLFHEIAFFFKQWGEYREHVLLSGGWMPNTAEIERALRAGEMDFGGFDDKQRKYLDLGKKLNGRDLDGVEWSQFPEVTR